MSYYWFNRQELLQKSKYKYHNCGEAAKYYAANKDVINEKANNKYQNLKNKKKQKENTSKTGIKK